MVSVLGSRSEKKMRARVRLRRVQHQRADGLAVLLHLRPAPLRGQHPLVQVGGVVPLAHLLIQRSEARGVELVRPVRTDDSNASSATLSVAAASHGGEDTAQDDLLQGRDERVAQSLSGGRSRVLQAMMMMAMRGQIR